MNNLIVLLIDGFSPRFLAPHGCTWIDTPTIDRIAGQSIVYQQAIAESNDPGRMLSGLFNGHHPVDGSAKIAHSSPLQAMRDAGFEVALYTDDPNYFKADSAEKALFDRSVCLNDSPLPTGPAGSISDTHLAASIARLSTELPSLTSPFVAVVHLSSMANCWDAPAAVREKYRDEEDPEASLIVEPEARQGEFDPDEILALSHAYAAQVETLDTCLDFLTGELDVDGMLEGAFLAFCGLRSFPLGHSGQFAHHSAYLQADAIQVPLMIKPPEELGNQFRHVRVHQVTSTRQAFASLARWAASESLESVATDVGQAMADRKSGEPVLIASEHSHAIWTTAWLATQTDQGVRLIVKPDDRWDVNPVQDRCRWIATEFEDAIFEVAKQREEGKSAKLGPLADELLQGLG